MTSVSVMLTFPRECVGDPVISDLVKEQGVTVNILGARIGHSEEGWMLARLEGTAEVLDSCYRSLERRGVEVAFPDGSLIRNEDACVHCGACAGICPSGAFTIDPECFEVAFDMAGCILCGLCVQVCCYGAIRPVVKFGGPEGRAR